MAVHVDAPVLAMFIGEILHGSAPNLHPDFQRLWRLHDRRLHGDHDFSLGHSRTSLAASLQPAGRASAKRWRLTASGDGEGCQAKSSLRSDRPGVGEAAG